MCEYNGMDPDQIGRGEILELPDAQGQKAPPNKKPGRGFGTPIEAAEEKIRQLEAENAYLRKTLDEVRQQVTSEIAAHTKGYRAGREQGRREALEDDLK